MKAILYNDSYKSEWNEFLYRSKNATFLIDRNFCEYHKSRFNDCSLIFFDNKNKICGLLASEISFDAQTVFSHRGLTYSPLITLADVHMTDVLKMFSLAIEQFKSMGAKHWLYKPIPYIYTLKPAQEDLYAAFRGGARLYSSSVSETVIPDKNLKFSQLRNRGIKKAFKYSLMVRQDFVFEEFYNILDSVLQMRHNAHPVHTLEELKLLAERFRNNIKLFTVEKNGKVLGGTIVFETDKVAHLQYIAISDEGKKLGAGDLLFSVLIKEVFVNKSYFDFGTSTLDNGTILNEGLIFQKEGFGCGAVCYDSYMFDF